MVSVLFCTIIFYTILGGGSAGSGAALDAATRGLHVACLEREDFGSGTSSRSTQLLWGGSRYLVQAFVGMYVVVIVIYIVCLKVNSSSFQS